MSSSPDTVRQVSDALRDLYEATFKDPEALHLVADFCNATVDMAASDPSSIEAIRALNLAMRSADTARRNWPPMFPDAVGRLFIGVEDAFARRFLGDIVLTRISRDEGRELNGKGPRPQQDEMLQEMGVSDVSGTHPMTLESVVAEVLAGRLLPSTQEKPEL